MKAIEKFFNHFILTNYYPTIVITVHWEILFGGVSCYTEGCFGTDISFLKLVFII